MSFSPLDPAVMRVTLNRNAKPTGASSALDRIDETVAFEEARLQGAYQQIERMLTDLLSMEFVAGDADAMGLLHDLFQSSGIEDFSQRFDHFADHVLQRLDALATDGADGAASRDRLRAMIEGGNRNAGRERIAPAPRSAALADQTGETAAAADTAPVAGNASPARPRMRLRL